MKLPLFLSACLSLAIFTSCTSNNLDGGGDGAATGLGLTSVVPKNAEGMKNLAYLEEECKVLVELAADDSAKAKYTITKRMVDKWIDQKTAEAERLALKSIGQVDLSPDSISSIVRAKNSFEEAVTTAGGETDESAIALGMVMQVASKAKSFADAKRAESVSLLVSQLEEMRWETWDEIRG
tara:strand:- start:3756 stop:4298 length:543 start_codon:yes stop_codon:yes gene_type:complete